MERMAAGVYNTAAVHLRPPRKNPKGSSTQQGSPEPPPVHTLWQPGETTMKFNKTRFHYELWRISKP